MKYWSKWVYLDLDEIICFRIGKGNEIEFKGNWNALKKHKKEMRYLF